MTGYYGYELNWLGIILGALVPMVVGFIWYHPKVFGKAWMKSLNFTEEDVQGGNMPVIFGLAFLMALTLSYYFAMRYHAHGEDSNFIMHAAYHGFMTFGYVGAPVLVSNLLFERRNAAGILINLAYWFVAVMGIAIVVYALPGAEVPEPAAALLR